MIKIDYERRRKLERDKQQLDIDTAKKLLHCANQAVVHAEELLRDTQSAVGIHQRKLALLIEERELSLWSMEAADEQT